MGGSDVLFQHTICEYFSNGASEIKLPNHQQTDEKELEVQQTVLFPGTMW